MFIKNGEENLLRFNYNKTLLKIVICPNKNKIITHFKTKNKLIKKTPIKSI